MFVEWHFISVGSYRFCWGLLISIDFIRLAWVCPSERMQTERTEANGIPANVVLEMPSGGKVDPVVKNVVLEMPSPGFGGKVDPV